MKPPTCAHGEPHPHRTPCQGCQADVQKGREEFAAGVRAGKWDSRGYTPAERRALAKEAKKHGSR